ncbi:MAG: class I SAM-dependent methyltransferase [Clostridia bacterium]|nr:class I SAM-dependent methyltransferase [Clostridia bacterium]
MDHTTAKVSCFARAFHDANNTVPVFADSAARQLLGEDYGRIAQSMTGGIPFFLPGFHGSPDEGLRQIVDRQLSPSVLGRSAYCERMLAGEQRLGCRQYVILASGYDTFAVRNRDTALSVYELDLPDVLADKQARIEKAGLASGAVYVPCNLADPAWKKQLTESGFRPGEKAFCSLLGISYYLEKEAFLGLLLSLSGLPCDGSALCLDYPSAEGSQETETNRALARGAGEQMKAQYSPEEMEALLADYGFLVYEHLDHAQMTGQCFAEHNRSCPDHPLEAPKGVCYLLAVRKST